MAPQPTRIVLVSPVEETRALIRMALDEDSRFSVVGETASESSILEMASALESEVVIVDEEGLEGDPGDTLGAIGLSAPELAVILLPSATTMGNRAGDPALGEVLRAEEALGIPNAVAMVMSSRSPGSF